jgi:hypothetical protein
MAKATRLLRPRTVAGDGEGLLSHAGLVWLGGVVDRGLTPGLSQVPASAPRRRHDPGVTLVQGAIVSTVTVPSKKQEGATRR